MILAPDKTSWPAEWLELWEERAAIMEVDGKMERSLAEREAELDIRRMVERR